MPSFTYVKGEVMNAIECKSIMRSVPSEQGVETILDIDTFTVKIAEQVCMMGPSGSGKTTFLHLLSGLTTPSKGTIQILGKDISAMSEGDKDQFRGERIGIVFQDFDLFPYMSARDNVLVQLLATTSLKKRDAVHKAEALLKKVGLEHRVHHKVSVLSRGQQQRVAIARALIHDPKLLLIDEPTSNLDVKTGLEIMKIIQAICTENQYTLVVVTHDPTIANLFNRTVKMEDLNNIYQNTLQEVLGI